MRKMAAKNLEAETGEGRLQALSNVARRASGNGVQE
jgi:hypothetical protein